MALTRKQKRLAVIGGLGVVVVLAAGLILTALRDQIVFFYTPAELVAKAVEPGQAVRIGGLVEAGSWVKQAEANTFVVSADGQDLTVHYVGILPDLFREGQGVIAEGSLSTDGSFAATSVLAKHDENYIPKELADQLKAEGEWRPETTASAP